MDPDNLLGTDADSIERTLDAFELYVEELERGAADPRDLERFVKLLDRVVESRYGAREEALLLAQMAVYGVAAGAELLSEARVRRHQARELLRTLKRVEHSATGHPRSVTRTARSYIDLVRAHLAWYRCVVGPMLQSRLSPEQASEAAAQEGEPPLHEQAELDALTEELVEAYSERRTPVQQVP